MTVPNLLKTYETALNANDVETILGLYSREPVFMAQSSPAFVGRDAVRRGYEQVFATIKLNVRFEVHEVQESGDWAWARTTSAGTTHVLGTNTEVTESNNELFVFRREKGDWKIHRYLFATIRPQH